jgi:dynein heavy chain, axonemal
MDTSKKKVEAAGMNSPEGEYVPYQAPVLTDGPVEYWMLAVEAAMRLTLKKILYQTMTTMKGTKIVHCSIRRDSKLLNGMPHKSDAGAGTKKEKWVSDWPGQLLITAGTCCMAHPRHFDIRISVMKFSCG